MFKSDVRAGHKIGAAYWKGAAAAMFVANPAISGEMSLEEADKLRKSGHVVFFMPRKKLFHVDGWQVFKLKPTKHNPPVDRGRLEWMERLKMWRVIWYRGRTEIKVGDYKTREEAWQVLRNMVEATAGQLYDTPQQARLDYQLRRHKAAVQQALREGKAVPERVLDEYPQANPAVITDNDIRKWNILGKHFWGDKHKKIDRAMVDSYLRDKQLDAVNPQPDSSSVTTETKNWGKQFWTATKQERERFFKEKGIVVNPQPDSSLYRAFHGAKPKGIRTVFYEPPKKGIPLIKVGRIYSISYEPESPSRHKNTLFEHKFGDDGYKVYEKDKPLLVTDKDGKNLYIVRDKDTKFPIFTSRGIIR